jgi:hypothetical protein
MARKKVEPIISLGDEDKLTVQKSLPLFSLWRSQLTLAEFKILDTYLSRINSHNPDKRSVVFEKGELEKLLGVKRIRTEELDDRLKNLGTPIRIDDATAKNKRFARISLFEKSVAEQDEHGLWQVELTASQSAMKYFFNVENLGYYRYKLRCITSIASRYTYIMFTYLEAHRNFKSWEVPLEELKKILDCENEECYKQFKVFNDRLLKRVHKEMHEKTECRYSYTPIKKGRYVVAIRFDLDPVRELREAKLAQQTVDDPQEPLYEVEDSLKEYAAACGGEFTQPELQVLVDLLPDQDEQEKIKLLQQAYHELQLQSTVRNIKHRHAYLRKIIQGLPSAPVPVHTEERTYDIEAFEQMNFIEDIILKNKDQE